MSYEGRIPINVRVTLRVTSGSVARTIEPVRTRDISATGACLLLTRSPEEDFGPQVPVSMDLPTRGQTLSLKGLVSWVRPLPQGRALVGIHFEGTDPKVIEQAVQWARSKVSRPMVVRVAATVALLGFLGAAALLLFTGQRHAAEVEDAERRLAGALAAKMAHERKLERLDGLIGDLEKEKVEQQGMLADKVAEVKRLRDEYESLQGRSARHKRGVGRAKTPSRPSLETAHTGQSSAPEVDLDTLSTPDLLALGHQRVRDRDLPGALRAYQTAVRRDPSLADAHLEIALINDLLERPAPAIKAYRRYLELRPDAPDAFEIQQTVRQLQTRLSDNP